MGIAMFGFVSNLGFTTASILLESFKFALTIAFYLAFSFSINNSFDAEGDVLQKEKAEKNPVATGSISFKESIVFSSCLAFIGLLLTYIWFRNCFTIYLVLIVLSLAYSAPPFRFKSVPFMDLVSHGLFFGALLYFYGVSALGRVTIQNILIGFSIFIYSAFLELRNHLNDFQIDLISGTKTTVCWLGYEKSLSVLKVLLILHWLFLLILSIFIYPIIRFPILIFVALFALAGKWMRFDYYLRLTDICTCIVYVLILLRVFDTAFLQLGGCL